MIMDTQMEQHSALVALLGAVRRYHGTYEVGPGVRQ